MHHLTSVTGKCIIGEIYLPTWTWQSFAVNQSIRLVLCERTRWPIPLGLCAYHSQSAYPLCVTLRQPAFRRWGGVCVEGLQSNQFHPNYQNNNMSIAWKRNLKHSALRKEGGTASYGWKWLVFKSGFVMYSTRIHQSLRDVIEREKQNDEINVMFDLMSRNGCSHFKELQWKAVRAVDQHYWSLLGHLQQDRAG